MGRKLGRLGGDRTVAVQELIATLTREAHDLGEELERIGAGIGRVCVGE